MFPTVSRIKNTHFGPRRSPLQTPIIVTVQNMCTHRFLYESRKTLCAHFFYMKRRKQYLHLGFIWIWKKMCAHCFLLERIKQYLHNVYRGWEFRCIQAASRRAAANTPDRVALSLSNQEARTMWANSQHLHPVWRLYLKISAVPLKYFWIVFPKCWNFTCITQRHA